MSRQYTFRHGRRAQSPRSEADTKDDAQGIGESTSHVIKEETGKEAGADQPDERQPISSTASSPQSNGTLTPVDEPERDTPKQVEKLAGMSDSYAAPPTSLQTSQGEGRASANGASGTGERGGSGDQAQTVPGTPPAPAAVVPKQEDTPTVPGATPGRDLAARQSATPETPQGQRVDSQGNPVPGIQGSLPLYQQAGSYQQHVSQMNQLGAVRYSPYQPSTLSVLEPDPRKRDEAIPQASISPHHLKVPDAQTMNYYDSRAGTAAGAPPASYDPSGMVQYYQPQNHQQAVPMDGSRQVVQAALAQPASTVPPPKQSAAQMMSTFSTNPTNTTPKRYKCDICEKRFTRPSSLQTHMYSHTGEKPFMCPVPECGRRFSVVSNLRRHQKIHAPKTNP